MQNTSTFVKMWFLCMVFTAYFETFTEGSTTTLILETTATNTLQNIPTTSLQNIPTSTLQNIPTTSLQNIPTTTLQTIPTSTLQNIPTTSLQNIPTSTLQITPTSTLQTTATSTIKEIPTTRTIKVSPFRVYQLREDLAEEAIITSINCTLVTAATDPTDVFVPKYENIACPTCNIQSFETDATTTIVTNVFNEFNYRQTFKIYRGNDGLFNDNTFFVTVNPNRGVPLNYDTVRTYRLTIVCSDDNNPDSDIQPGTQKLEIDIRPNNPPTFNRTTQEIVRNAQQPFIPGAEIHRMVYSDDENDTLTFSMTVDPASVDYFQINERTGVITAAKDLRTATVSPVNLLVYVSDGRHTTGPSTVTVIITNLNARPSITNLPINVTVLENEDAGYQIADLIFDTTTLGAFLNEELNVFPESEAGKFRYNRYDKTIRLVEQEGSSTILDAESVNLMNLSFTLFDGYLYSVDEYILLTVANVNEAPYFNRSVHHCFLLESNHGGSICDLNLKIRDPEGDTILSPTLNAANNTNNYFTLSGGFLRIGQEYTVDRGEFPSQATLTIEVTDVNGATGSSLIQVTVSDQNTQTPVFAGSDMRYLITPNTKPGTTLATITATDGDLTSPNNFVTMQLRSSNLGTHVIFDPNNGQITYFNEFDTDQDCSNCKLEIIAFDEGRPTARTATTTFYIGYTTTTSTSTTTSTTSTTTTSTSTSTTTQSTVTTSSDIFSSEAGAAVLGLLIALLVLAVLAVLGYFLYRFCRFGTCCGPTGPNGQGAICGQGGGPGGPGGPGGAGRPGGGPCGNCCGDPPAVTPEPPPKQEPFGTDVYGASGDYHPDFWNKRDGYGDVGVAY